MNRAHRAGNMAVNHSTHSNVGVCSRLVWGFVWSIGFRFSPVPLFWWRRTLLRIFGAHIGPSVHVYPSARIWAPWNLTMGECSCLGRWVDCYCVDKITVEAHATVSQYSYLCTAGHDIRDRRMPLTTKPIMVRRYAWVAAGAFIGPGVTIGEGAVVGARGCVYKSVRPWLVVGGNPARVIGRRRIREGL
jgi:putative colanic acid biosynthesis acetyltransferase WcaF